MADVKDSDKRWPDPHKDWEFPYGHIIWRSQDGSFMGFYEKNGQNTIFMQHGVSGTYIEMNGSGDMITATKGHNVAYNMSGKTETTDGTVDTKESVRRHQTAGGSYQVVGGKMDTCVMGQCSTVVAGTDNRASLQDSYHGVQGSSKTHVSKNKVTTVVGNDTETIQKGNKTLAVQSGNFGTQVAQNITTVAGPVHQVDAVGTVLIG